MLRESPIVYAVGEHYQIVCRVTASCLCVVQVGDRQYADANNGVLCSASNVHRVEVPMSVLDAEKRYTVCLRRVTERKPYFTETEAFEETTFLFSPVPKDALRVFHISDTHERVHEAVAAAKAFGAFDLLVFNGDLANHNDTEEQAEPLFAIASALTGGSLPVVFSRGNHDTRGAFAERFTEYIPTADGHTYYTFRLGGVWGLVLDCGEDKEDSHAEYGFTVDFHAFRERETAFLQSVVQRKEYVAEGIHTRLVIVHNPFTHQLQEPFDIEEPLYRRWASILDAALCPDLMLCGHLHSIGIHKVGSPFDHLGQPCPVLVGGEPSANGFTGVGLEIDAATIKVFKAGSDGNVTPIALLPKVAL